MPIQEDNSGQKRQGIPQSVPKHDPRMRSTNMTLSVGEVERKIKNLNLRKQNELLTVYNADEWR